MNQRSSGWTELRLMKLHRGKAVPEVIRQAAQQFITHLERVAEEEREREIFSRHRVRLNRQAAALIREQAK
jgi:hypothetical protein